MDTHKLNLPSILISLAIGIPLLVVVAPLVGEMAATMAPIPLNQQSFQIPVTELAYEDVEFQNEDQLWLRGWFFPAEDPGAPAIIYAPPTSHDQRTGLSVLKPLHQAGFHVLLFSFRGTGISEGNRVGFTYGYNESKDIDAAVHYLSDERGIHQIGAIGHSAGAVSILLSAADNPLITAIVAASPFPSLDEIWETNRPSFFPKTLYNLVMRLAELRKGFSRTQVQVEQIIQDISPRPLMIIHGSADRRVTLVQARRLFAKARNPKQFIVLPGATHHEARDPGLSNQIDVIIKFFKQSLVTAHGQADHGSLRTLSILR